MHPMTLKAVVITPVFMGEFPETQSYQLACPMVELACKFAMSCCKCNIIHSFFPFIYSVFLFE